MIHADAFEIQDVETGRFFGLRYLSEPGRSRYAPEWRDDWPSGGDWFNETKIERVLGDFEGQPDQDRILWHVRIPVIMVSEWSSDEQRWRWISADPGFYEMIVRKARRPCCECCGGNPYRHNWKPRRKIQEVEDGTWRCEKHVGRNPCAIEGCGKTRAGRHPSSESHLCGAHWKLAPHALKLIYRRHWRLANRHKRKRIGDRQGFTEELNSRYWRNWNRLIRETRLVVNPPKVEIEVVASGPPPAALLAELERLGL